MVNVKFEKEIYMHTLIPIFVGLDIYKNNPSPSLWLTCKTNDNQRKAIFSRKFLSYLSRRKSFWYFVSMNNLRYNFVNYQNSIPAYLVYYVYIFFAMVNDQIISCKQHLNWILRWCIYEQLLTKFCSAIMIMSYISISWL